MSKKYNYYSDQLEKLTETAYFKTLQIRDGLGVHTHNMHLNKESIPVLIKYLENELKKLPL